MNGILVVDKPAGCTSHDVVQRVRKALRQRSVGHAGTLDPLATGVLVIAIGEATKLVSTLQADDKWYAVVIALGQQTDSLDADGTVTATADVPALDRATVEQALTPFIGRHPQAPPRLSAIKVGGTPLHRRVRRGEDVEAPTREVELHTAVVDDVDEDSIALTLHCAKGFYVRSLARDLAQALGTVGHVRALRRTASGRFTLDRAIGVDSLDADAVASHLIPLREACEALRRVELTAPGVSDARHGRPLGPDALADDSWRQATADETLALFAPDGEPIALGRRTDEGVRVVRGFAGSEPDVVGA